MTPRPVTAVHLTEEAARVITDELRTADNSRETGGILLGHHVHDAMIVRHAGTPGPDAVQTPTYFLRDLAHAQDHSVWIGEWHTHPTSRPIPSTRDATTYRQLLNDPELAFHSFIAVILGPRAPHWDMTAWTCHNNTIAQVAVHGPPQHR
ncbi:MULTISPECIES: Mov34/MPN/PAD-1 family protein [Streptomyces]|uniref:Mov34/MPN/PAD-1 family protein n=1 Tax=Streptomyces lycopersici TaxID=2974589 RepID=UPI0021CF275C|nr:Mov34/MPN/PAD-1 family protein [Streptomyces sp. NEAU-383]